MSAKEAWLLENRIVGEIYAGIILGQNGTPDYHLFVDSVQICAVNWDDAKIKVRHFNRKYLPSFKEMQLIAANTIDFLQSMSIYWTADEYDKERAWAYCSIRGEKISYTKSDRYFRALSVRKVDVNY